MNGIFKDGLTAAMLKEMGVKLSPSPYDKSLHFDLNVKGDKVAALDDKKVFTNVVNYNLKAAQDFIPKLNYAEVTDPFHYIRTHLTPADLRVRVFGSVEQEGEALINWQLIDVEEDIKKMWKRVERSVKQAETVQEVSDSAESLVDSFKVKGSETDAFGTWVTLDKTAANKLAEVAAMTNVKEIITEENGDVTAYFTGKYMTFTFKSGDKIVFLLRNPATGMKGEAEELYIGIFFENRYFTRKAI